MASIVDANGDLEDLSVGQSWLPVEFLALFPRGRSIEFQVGAPGMRTPRIVVEGDVDVELLPALSARLQAGRD